MFPIGSSFFFLDWAITPCSRIWSSIIWLDLYSLYILILAFYKKGSNQNFVTYGFFILFHSVFSIHHLPFLLFSFSHKLLIISLHFYLLILSNLIPLFLMINSQLFFFYHVFSLSVVLSSKIFLKLKEFFLDFLLSVLTNLFDHSKSIFGLFDRWSSAGSGGRGSSECSLGSVNTLVLSLSISHPNLRR